MNRLVIIGNGFDLAHGLKTSYSDFFNWLWTYQLVISEPTCYFDNLRSVTRCKITNDIFSLSFTTHDRLYNNDTVKLLYLDKISSWSNSFIDDSRNTININYNSSNIFFSELLKYRNRTNQWADIEKLFFNLLTKEAINIDSKIKNLNNDFEKVKNLFERYLLTIDTEKTKKIHSIYESIYIREGRLINHGIINKNAKILILNFNYTNTPNIYIGTSDTDNISLSAISIDIETNQIHGELNNIDNPIIFGYGDERGEEYKKIELLDNNDFFEHIKSFAYLNTPNYAELIDFLNEELFDTVIIGHSCGLTDRTLLNTIFEHNNCRKIRPLYYKNKDKDNYQDIVRNISRCFNDKAKMRSLVTNKYESSTI